MEVDPASRRWLAGIIAIGGVSALAARAFVPGPTTSWWTGLAFLAFAALQVTPEGTRTNLALRVVGLVFALLSFWHIVSYYLS